MFGELESEKLKNNTKLCVDTSKLEIKGEPSTITEASAIIELVKRPDVDDLFEFEVICMS